MNNSHPPASIMAQRSTLRSILKQSLILYLIGGVGFSLLFWNFLDIQNFKGFLLESFFQGMTWILLWVGNGLISEYLDRKFSWLEKTEWRFSLGVLSMMVYTITSISILLAFRLMVMNGFTLQEVINIYNPSFYSVALVVTVFIAMFMHGKAFLKEWRNSASEAERLKNENLKARFETLKNQVNPHFLFNSLNTLTYLIPEDEDRAVAFVQQLSKVYRYILEIRDEKLIPLSEELKFLDAYIYLLKERFGNNIHVKVNVPEVTLGHKVVPLSLQLLLENAIKHNIISNLKPLMIEVFVEKGKLIVRNNLQKKNQVMNSTKAGLQNIKNRYSFFSNKKVEVLNTSEYFIVMLPLLRMAQKIKVT